MTGRTFGIGVVGCGYVLDDYLRTLSLHPGLRLIGVTDLDADRAERAARRYGTRHFASTDDLLADPEVEVVLNLTDPQSHFAVSRAALLAGRHVYSEKPLALRAEDGVELVRIARETGRWISGAPCNLLSESWAAARRLVTTGAIGCARLVYAELDDNPIHLMHPDKWRSESGTPWPYQTEFQVGCTLEHAGYHVAALAALFGPVQSVTAFSSCLVPSKSPQPLDGPEAPDFSVAALTFASGAVARLTCSIVAPYDHRVRIVGDTGMVTLEEVWHNHSPVLLEQFDQLSLNARKIRAVRRSSLLRGVTGVGGRRQPMSPQPRPPRPARHDPGSWSASARAELRRRQMTSMDLLLGVDDLRRADAEDRRPVITAEFLLHVTEVTLAIAAGSTPAGGFRPSTTFDPLRLPETGAARRARLRPQLVARLAEQVLPALHRRS